MSASRGSLVLGIDLGGTKILAAVVDAGGKIISREQVATPAAEGPEAVIRAVLGCAQRALAPLGTSVPEVLAVGVGAAGLSNPETGVLYTSPNLPGWQDVPLRDILEKSLGKTVYIINDANAAAVGELYFGAARGARNLVYITVSTGIGGGIIINGRIYTGATGTAGEVGHMVIDHHGPPCSCGNTGCWEVLASGTALAREGRRLLEEGVQTALLDYSGGEIGKVSAETIHKAALAGDETAKGLIRRSAYYLGVGLANLVNIFNPELVVIGGGLSNMGDMLLRPAYEETGRRAFRQPYQAVRFALAGLGGDSGVIGAAAYALEKANER